MLPPAVHNRSDPAAETVRPALAVGGLPKSPTTNHTVKRVQHLRRAPPATPSCATGPRQARLRNRHGYKRTRAQAKSVIQLAGKRLDYLRYWYLGKNFHDQGWMTSPMWAQCGTVSVKKYPVVRPGSPGFTGKSVFGIVGIGYGMARGGGKIG